MIGAFGEIVFEAGADTIRTFKQFRSKWRARFAQVNVMDDKPVLQFIGPDLGEINFRMDFVAGYVDDPREEIQKLKNILASGEPQFLNVGGRPVSNHPFVLKSIDEDWRIVDSQGWVSSAGAAVTLQEHPRR